MPEFALAAIVAAFTLTAWYALRPMQVRLILPEPPQGASRRGPSRTALRNFVSIRHKVSALPLPAPGGPVD
jgi:hypothetical protein